MLIDLGKRKERELTDFGRTYGWTILLNDKVIGGLKYLRWCDQFWHEYGIVDWDYRPPVEDDKFYEYWRGIVLVNNRYENCISQEYIPSRRDGNVVAIRNLFVQDRYYKGRT